MTPSTGRIPIIDHRFSPAAVKYAADSCAAAQTQAFLFVGAIAIAASDCVTIIPQQVALGGNAAQYNQR